MRKPTKAMIEAAVFGCDKWAEDIEPMIAAIGVDGAQRIIRAEVAQVRRRIAAGDNGHCTTAHIRSVMRMIEDFTSGFYIGVTSTGGFICRTYSA